MKLRDCRAMTIVWCALVFGGCAAGAAATDVAGARTFAAQRMRPDCIVAPVADEDVYHIRPGDKLHITFYLNPEFDTDASPRPDGKIELAAVGEVTAVGLTPVQLEAELNRLYLKELRDPGATVRVDESPARVVFVTGEVARPGVVPLAPGMTALQAVAASGGLTDSAGPNKVVLVRRDACGQPYDEPLNLSQSAQTEGESGRRGVSANRPVDRTQERNRQRGPRREAVHPRSSAGYSIYQRTDVLDAGSKRTNSNGNANTGILG